MSTKKRTVPRPWTKRDVSAMRRAARSGLSAREAQKILKRTRGAIAFKAMKVGVHFHAVRQPPGVQKRRARAARRR